MPNNYSTKSLFLRYALKAGIPDEPKKFKGVKYKELLKMEQIFKVKILVFELNKNNKSTVIWTSTAPAKDCKELHLNLYGNHFSLITNLNQYAQNYRCITCDAMFTRNSNLLRHTTHNPTCLSNQTSKAHFHPAVKTYNIFSFTDTQRFLDYTDAWYNNDNIYHFPSDL